MSDFISTIVYVSGDSGAEHVLVPSLMQALFPKVRLVPYLWNDGLARDLQIEGGMRPDCVILSIPSSWSPDLESVLNPLTVWTIVSQAFPAASVIWLVSDPDQNVFIPEGRSDVKPICAHEPHPDVIRRFIHCIALLTGVEPELTRLVH